MSWDPPGAGGRCWGEGCLGYFAWPAAATQIRCGKWTDGRFCFPIFPFLKV